MSDASRYHCRSCMVRPRANLTLHDGKLWRPECLYTVAFFQAQHQTLAPPKPPPSLLEQSRAAPHGLVVVEGRRRGKRTRAEIVRDAKGVLR